MTYKSLVHKLGCQKPRTTRELLDIATNHTFGEEALGIRARQSSRARARSPPFRRARRRRRSAMLRSWLPRQTEKRASTTVRHAPPSRPSPRFYAGWRLQSPSTRRTTLLASPDRDATHSLFLPSSARRDSPRCCWMDVEALDAMGIPRPKLRPVILPFHSVIPGMRAYPLGQIDLPAMFGNCANFHTEVMTFEVVDFPGSYHAILGHGPLGGQASHFRPAQEICRAMGRRASSHPADLENDPEPSHRIHPLLPDIGSGSCIAI